MNEYWWKFYLSNGIETGIGIGCTWQIIDILLAFSWHNIGSCAGWCLLPSKCLVLIIKMKHWKMSNILNIRFIKVQQPRGNMKKKKITQSLSYSYLTNILHTSHKYLTNILLISYSYLCLNHIYQWITHIWPISYLYIAHLTFRQHFFKANLQLSWSCWN